MWQRFTERARRVVFFAQEEAGRLGQSEVGTEHFLLGLLRENDSVAARVLDRLGFPLGQIRSELERKLPHGEEKPGRDMQLNPQTKRALDFAYEEATLLRNSYIGTEHFLLGLIREGEGLAGRVLAELGVELEAVQRETRAMQDGNPRSSPAAQPVKGELPLEGLILRLSEEARQSLRAAEAEASRLGAEAVTGEHLLLGLIGDANNAAYRLLAEVGIPEGALRKELASRIAGKSPKRASGLPLSPPAKQILGFAWEEAVWSECAEIGTEHLLLGLVREPNGAAKEIFTKLGIEDRLHSAGKPPSEKKD